MEVHGHLNSYAYEGLLEAESALFAKYFNAEGKDHREFCELFGPEKIIGSCTCSVRISLQPENQVVYHRFPRGEGKRYGRQPPFP